MIEIVNEETGLTEEWYTVGEMAKIIGLKDSNDLEIGRNKLFKLLRDEKILMDNNYPYQHYVNLDMVMMRKVQKIRHTVHIPIFSQRGVNYMKKRLNKTQL